MTLALENRHRAITFVHLACTGSEVSNGLFMEKDAREQFDKPNSLKVPAQFDQLSDLICRSSAARNRASAYTLPMYSHGSTGIEMKTIAMRWCPPEQRKRPIDLVLLSIGGNDVGFSAVALYSVTESADGVDWSQPVATGAGNGQITAVTLDSHPVRYIRVALTASVGNWWSVADVRPTPTTLGNEVRV